MTITSILQLFHLLISSIAGIYSFSGCSHYLEASQVIYAANRLTGFFVMGISIERHFWAIGKIVFFVNMILLLLPVLRLAMIFLICIYLVFFTLYFFSTLVSGNLVGKNIGRFACFDLGSTITDAVPWSAQLFLTILLLSRKTLIFNDAS